MNRNEIEWPKSTILKTLELDSRFQQMKKLGSHEENKMSRPSELNDRPPS